MSFTEYAHTNNFKIERKEKKKKKALKMLKDIKGIHERVGWWLLQQGEKQHYFTVQIKGSGKAAYL